jgi:carboxymethylenebutenolidase
VRVLLWSFVLTLLAACQGDGQPPDAGAAGATPAAAGAERPRAARLEPAGQEADFSPRKPVIEETIAYGEATNRNLNGVLTLPADSFEPPPGVLIIHEWRGLDDTVRVLARRLAGEGFVVLAIDLYEGEVAASSAQAQELMTGVMTDPQAALDNIRQGIEYLRKYALAPRVATIGWSFGGTWSLQAGLSHAEAIDAVVMYYGQIATNDIEIDRLESPLLGLFAGADESITAESVVAFRAALRRAGKNADLRIFPDMRHEFATPGSDNYRAEAAEDAWSRTIEFLNMHLR